ncbi:TPA: hypothetical protein N2D99_002096 [Clostridium botulinum]|nr:hypothetical protein [Clostridium botulinum]
MYIVNSITSIMGAGATVKRNKSRIYTNNKEKSCKDCYNFNETFRICKKNNTALTIFTYAKNCKSFDKKSISFQDFLNKAFND